MSDAPTQLLINGELRDAAARVTFTLNTPFIAFPGIPFGGFKESGYGREQFLEALDLHTETKAVLQGTSPKPMNPFGI